MKCCACNQTVKLNNEGSTSFYEPLCEQQLEIALETLKAISRNSCCETCQEAKSFALAALEKIRNLRRLE